MTGLFVGCSFYKLNAGESLANTIIVVRTLVSPIEAFMTHNRAIPAAALPDIPAATQTKAAMAWQTNGR
ncbi:hypothetical protein KZX50_16500 [Bacillus infantis]|uniref:hypothetical protein n=1 Tax=Bacillus infantis TaxID=324767 RepID=UPI000B9B6D4D|nr:hypothetical protein [Bacillus infantis]MCK6207045.1 hypothetical protein [Bacillus infantis]OXT15072.1 hypothetical protein B9K06_22970 [Bacillus sp. OG2]